jgi:hypothetical protein
MTTTQTVAYLQAPHQWAALIGSLLLIPAMLWAFRAGQRRFGFPLGYLLAFALYWVGWCLIVPEPRLGWPAGAA